VFVTPAEMGVVVSTSDGSGDPGGLLCFGLTCAAIFGLPGCLSFPYQRRLQAVAWLALACAAYSLLIFGILTTSKLNPQMLSSPAGRDFVQKLTIHYDRLAAITIIQLAVWATLFRRKRGDSELPAAAEPRGKLEDGRTSSL
jgi:hypothetical protein